MSDNIQVAVRMRPLISREIEHKAAILWKAEEAKIIRQANNPSVQFTFDRVFEGNESNEIVYAEFCSHLVKSVIDGFNGTIFAYGQTSSGKTFTISGSGDGKEFGIIHYTISDIFNLIQGMPDRNFLLRVSYMEVYNEMVTDLLSEKNENLKLMEDRYGYIKVNGLSEHIVQESSQVYALMKKGEKKRRTGDTLMNKESSRSHSIFQVIIESVLRSDENAAVNVSQFNLVDLAGSERVSQTGAKGARFKESININRSLMMLGQVISQLSERTVADQYINYRDSKLTRILQNSLGGNALTAIICTVTPATLDETISTLKFATRAKSIKNKPKVNEVLTEQALLKRYANEIKKLTKELEATKEEKAQQNKHLQEQILSLKKQFVSHLPQEANKRAIRRETWGGCLDAARLKLFAPQRTLSSSDLFTEELSKPRKSLTFPRNVTLDEDYIAPLHPRRSRLLSDLPMLEEESEFEINAIEENASVERSLPEQTCDSPSQTEAVLKIDAVMQTDIEASSSTLSFGTPVDSEKEQLRTQLELVERELAELKEFTQLERQFFRAQNKSQMQDASISMEHKDEKSRGILLIENLTPKGNKSRFSIGSDAFIGERNDSLTNYSSTPIPIYSSTHAINRCKLTSKDVELSKSLLDLKPSELISLPPKSEPEGNNLSSDKEELFHYLDNTVKILSKRMHIKYLSETNELSGHYKIILDMFNLILQYQCSVLNSSSSSDLSNKIIEISEYLSVILLQLYNKNISHDTAEDMIENFMNKMESILKEIDMHSLGINCEKDLSDNQLMTIKNSEVFCSDTSDMIMSCLESYSPVKNFIDRSINTSITDTDSSKTVSHSTDFEIQFKTKISELEKDIDIHLNTISDLMKEKDLKIEQVAGMEKELQAQKQIIVKLQEDLARNILDNNEKVSLSHSLSSEKTNALNDEIEKSTIILHDISSENHENLQPGMSVLHKDEMQTSEEDLKNKHIILFKDKIQIQEQIIEHLKEELSLINSEKEISEINENLNSATRNSITFKDNPCQTSGLEINCSKENESKSVINKSSVYIQCDLFDKNKIDESGSREIQQSINDVPENSVLHIKAESSDVVNFEAVVCTTLKDLKELRQFTFEFMEKCMEKEYIGDVTSSQENANPSETGSLSNEVRMQVSALKEMLSRLQFYMKCKSESYEYFYNMLEKTSVENSSLKQKCSDSESELQKKKADLLNLEDALINLEKKMSIFVEKCEAPMYFDLENTNFLSSKNSKTLNRIFMLQEMVQKLDSFLEERKMMLKEAECKLASLQEKSITSIKVCKSVQTDEDTEFVKIIKKLRESEIAKDEIQKNFDNLKLSVETLNKKKEDLEHELETKEVLFNTRIENLNLEHQKDKSAWNENTIKCVKTVEEKCDQMLTEQENNFFEKLSEVRRDHSRQLKEKFENHNNELEQLISSHKNQVILLKEEHLKQVADLQDKLSKVMQEQYSERTKLEETIKKLEREVFIKEELKSKFKHKCKQYAEEIQRLRSKQKTIKDSEVQTSQTQLNLNDHVKVEKSYRSQGTQPMVIEIPKELLMESDFCNECVSMLQKRYYLKNHKLQDNLDGPEVSAYNKRLAMELETKKAKIMSLTRNNESLVKELSTKSALLRSCRCRVIPKSTEGCVQTKQETNEKRRELQYRTDQAEAKSSEKNGIVFESESDLLKSDLVQRAIESALEEQKGMLTGGSGPANMLANCMLKNKLNKAEKQLVSKQKELAELKTYASKRQSIQESENQPSKASDFEEKDFTMFTQAKHPYPIGAVPKVRAKTFLKEKNEAFSTPISNLVENKVEEKHSVYATPAPYNPLLPELRHSQSKETGGNGKDVYDELFSVSEPNCKQQ